jgi:hypothetical protein
VLAGGGGAALAADNTNVLLSSTRMEALGLAAGMSYARNWVGKVDWYIGNMGVINNFHKMHRCGLLTTGVKLEIVIRTGISM